MIRLFKSNHFPALILAIVFLSAWAFILRFFGGQTVVMPEKGYPVGQWLLEGMNQAFGIDSLTAFLLWLVLVVTQSVLFGVLAEKLQLLYKNTWLPVVFFGLSLMVFPSQLIWNGELLANCFLVFAVMALFRAQGKDRALPALINSGIAAGLALLFSPGTLLFLPVFFLGIWLFKPIRLLDIFQFLFGYTFFPILGFSLVFGTEEWPLLLDYFSQPLFSLAYNPIWQEPYFLGFGIYISLLFLFTFVRMQQNFFRNTVKVRKMQQFLVFYFVLSLLFVLAGNQSFKTGISLLSLPVSVFMSYHFLPDKRAWFREIEFWLILAGIFLLHVPLF